MYLSKSLRVLGKVTAFMVLISMVSISFGTAEELPAAVQAKVDKGLKELAGWAADPDIIKALKEANGKKGIPGMTNGKWEELTDKDTAIATLLANPVSQKLLAWEKSGGYQKLMLRDSEAYLVAGSEKPLLYNNATRPQYKVPSEGKNYHAKEVKPDPTTQVKSVQIGVPVKDGDKVIGVLHAGVAVE